MTMQTTAPGLSRTVVPPHAVGDLPGFEEYYGVLVAPLGEDGDAYLALGHPDARYPLAASLRWARVNYWQTYRDRRYVEVEQRWAVFTATTGLRNWHVDYAEAGTAGAVPVTLITGLEGLEYRMRPSRCPMCRRVRATGREYHDREPYYPDKPTTWVHECPCTGGLVGRQWPATPITEEI